jgi:hypothetical protein
MKKGDEDEGRVRKEGGVREQSFTVRGRWWSK